jgi:hypothetical protein
MIIGKIYFAMAEAYLFLDLIKDGKEVVANLNVKVADEYYIKALDKLK